MKCESLACVTTRKCVSRNFFPPAPWLQEDLTEYLKIKELKKSNDW